MSSDTHVDDHLGDALIEDVTANQSDGTFNSDVRTDRPASAAELTLGAHRGSDDQ